MSEKRIRHVPVVVENGKFVGLVTHRDVLRCAFPLDEAQPVSARVDLLTTVRVGDIMTQDVKTVRADTDLAVAARIMFLRKYGCLPVVEDGVLKGIITEADFVRLIVEQPFVGQRSVEKVPARV